MREAVDRVVDEAVGDVVDDVHDGVLIGAEDGATNGVVLRPEGHQDTACDAFEIDRVAHGALAVPAAGADVGVAAGRTARGTGRRGRRRAELRDPGVAVLAVQLRDSERERMAGQPGLTLVQAPRSPTGLASEHRGARMGDGGA